MGVRNISAAEDGLNYKREPEDYGEVHPNADDKTSRDRRHESG